MMLDKIKLFLLLFAGTLLFACSEEQGNGFELPDSEDSLIQVSIRKDGSSTYAPTEEPAFAQEKEIKSIAFFVQCGDKGTPGDVNFRNGAFNKFFSTEDLRSIHGLYEPLEATANGYNTSIRVKGEAIENPTKVMVIANYAENGMTDALMAVTRWEDLETVKTPALTNNNLATPLLMYALDATVNLTQGNTVPVTFKLERVASRIDVVNKAFDETDPAKGFVLEKVSLVAPRQYSFLVPGNTKRHDIPTLESLPFMLVGNAPAYDKNQVTGMYLYETNNADGGAEKTRVRIEGKLFNSPYSKVIALKQPDVSYTQVGDPIAMLRNHLYRIVITPLVSEEIEADIEIVDWSDGTKMDLKPTQKAPVLSDFTVTNNAGIAKWDATNKIYTYDGAQSEVITFKATGNQSMLADFSCEYITPNISVGLDYPNSDAYKQFIQKGEPVVTYTSVSQEFTINLPTFENNNSGLAAIHIKLNIRNATSPQYAETIMIRCLSRYENSPYFPVRIDGLFWAPLNVGATTIVNSPASLAGTGYYYQWGRNKPIDSYSSFNKTSGPVSYSSANGTSNFIKSSGDWLNSGDSNQSKRNNLWSKSVNDSPCPKGWRVPSVAEINTLKNHYINQSRMRNSHRGDDRDTLYISYNGYINASDGAVSHSNYTHIWSSESASSTEATLMYDYGKSTKKLPKATGMPVRCVRDAK
ncbi:hypothetical protein LJC38_01570 [Parabacteroides sp. OttesenSCG-928-K15]|nr:hypothetical protein [Parabacteroides sp. OttesenSCG-928-K15]